MSRIHTGHLVVATTPRLGIVYFGPFATQERAQIYASSLPLDHSYSIRHLILPGHFEVHIKDRTITEKAAPERSLR